MYTIVKSSGALVANVFYHINQYNNTGTNILSGFPHFLTVNSDLFIVMSIIRLLAQFVYIIAISIAYHIQKKLKGNFKATRKKMFG